MRGDSIGTSYFYSRLAAIRYYRLQGTDAAAVDQKLAEGDIHIGIPPIKAGEQVRLITDEGRYEIVTGV